MQPRRHRRCHHDERLLIRVPRQPAGALDHRLRRRHLFLELAAPSLEQQSVPLYAGEEGRGSSKRVPGQPGAEQERSLCSGAGRRGHAPELRGGEAVVRGLTSLIVPAFARALSRRLDPGAEPDVSYSWES